MAIPNADPNKTANTSPATAKGEQRPDAFVWVISVLASLTCLFSCFTAISAVVLTGLSLYQFNEHLFAEKTTLTFQVDSTTALDRQSMRDIVKTLSERSNIFGYANVSIRITGFQRDKITVKMPKGIDEEEYIAQVTPVGLVELVDIGKHPYPTGTIIKTDFDYPCYPRSYSLATVMHTVMTNSSIKSASMRTEDDRYFVDIETVPDEIDPFREYSTNHPRIYLALVLDKKLLIAPQIEEPIPDGRMYIEWLNEEEALMIAAYLSTRPLPAPLVIEK